MELFFRLIRIALGKEGLPDRQPTIEEWEVARDLAMKHAILGFLFPAVDAIRRQVEELNPDIILEWMAATFQLEDQNVQRDKQTRRLYERFKRDGVRTCVLKGQGLARLYPVPNLRHSGDIDLWVEGRRSDTLALLKKMKRKVGKVVIHHVDARFFKDVTTEIHFIPAWLYQPWYNRRLQRFFKENEEEQFSQYDEVMGFSYPTVRFNAVYVLVHAYHHLLDEGIGLRQVIDYYYVLMHLAEEDKEKVMVTLAEIGLKKFAAAMMYVLQTICLLEPERMLCQPDERAGRFMLEEVLQTGNLGLFDERYEKKRKENAFTRNRRKWRRQWHFLRFFPTEVAAIPFWKLWHWGWRKWKGY